MQFSEAAYSLGPGSQGDFDSPVLRIGYTSLTTPTSTIDLNMKTGKRCAHLSHHAHNPVVSTPSGQ